MQRTAGACVVVVIAFLAGFCAHILYQRWNPRVTELQEGTSTVQSIPNEVPATTPQQHRVNFAPLAPAPQGQPVEMPTLAAREIDKIRALTGSPARVRGRVFRVGHSAKSNTYFLNFGPSREALTVVIFASAVELFEKSKISPKKYENKDVEVTGEIKDHPQYGLEVIVENPKQIRVID